MKIIGSILTVAILSFADPVSAQGPGPSDEDRVALRESLLADGADPAAEPDIGLPSNWPAMVDRYLESRLKDPYSAVKRVTRGPRHGTVSTGFASSVYGWAVCYDINAKNSYGGYNGATRFVFVIGRGGVISSLTEDSYPDARITEECAMPADPLAAQKAARPVI